MAHGDRGAFVAFVADFLFVMRMEVPSLGTDVRQGKAGHCVCDEHTHPLPY
jgi:hypothetical protein